MSSKFIKIGLFFYLFLVVAVITSSIRIELFGANREIKQEIIKASTKKEIDRIFYFEKASRIDSLLQVKTKKHFFNGNVLVAYGGDCIYNKSFGYASMSKKNQLKNDDIFQMASISKQFTAMAIMILMESGELSYEDTVTKYIVGFPYPDITIRMLLNHTSGLPNYMWLVEHHWKEKKAPYNSDILKLMAEHELPLYFKSGTRWDYSNTGYIVLASIVEKVAGESFADFMQENIFEPLEMNNTFVRGNSSDIKKNDGLIGYYYRGKRYRMIPETVNDGAVGDKGIYSTTEDLFKWDRALYGNLLISEETMLEAISSFKLRNKYEIPYGFGFRLKKKNNKKIAYHHGRWNGFRTSIVRYVEDTNTVIVLNHTSSSQNGSIIRGIQKILDDTLSLNLTYNLITSIMNKEFEDNIETYFKNLSLKEQVLDTIKLLQASEILYEKNNPLTAERLSLIREMYIKSRHDIKSTDNRDYLRMLSFKCKNY